MVKKGLCPVSFDHPGVTSFQGASDVYKGPSVSFFVFVVNAERDQAQLLVCHLHHAKAGPVKLLPRAAGFQFTSRVKVVVWISVPDVAVTVTVEVMVCDPAPEEPLPHALSKPNPATLTPSSNIS